MIEPILKSTILARVLPLLGICCAVVLIRAHYFDVPLERDEGEYAYMGQQILKGEIPYKEAWNMKLPGVYYCYALSMSVLGQTTKGIRIGALLFVLGSITLLYLMTLRLTGVWGAIFAGSGFAFLSSLSSVLGMFAHSELFSVFFIIAGMYTLMRWWEDRKIVYLVISGIAFGLAYICKQHAIFFIPAGIIALFLRRKEKGSIKQIIIEAVVFTVAAVLPYVLIAGYMAECGVFDRFWFWTVGYARSYVSQVPWHYAPMLFMRTIVPIIKSGLVFWCLAVCGFFLMFLALIDKRIIAVLLMSAAGFCAVVPGFYFRQHYFIFLLPFIAFWSGYCIHRVASVSGNKIQRSILGISFALLLLIGIGTSVKADKRYSTKNNPERISRMIYGPNPFIEAVSIAQWIDEHSNVTDRIGILGSEPEIYFYSRRKAATGFLYTYPLMESHKDAIQMQQQFAHEIEERAPRFLVYVRVPTSWLLNDQSDMWIFDWYRQFKEKDYSIAGLAEINPDTTLYYWDKDKIPSNPISEYWVAVYERIKK
jgi:hypothetical protein